MFTHLLSHEKNKILVISIATVIMRTMIAHANRFVYIIVSFDNLKRIIRDTYPTLDYQVQILRYVVFSQNNL